MDQTRQSGADQDQTISTRMDEMLIVGFAHILQVLPKLRRHVIPLAPTDDDPRPKGNCCISLCKSGYK